VSQSKYWLIFAIYMIAVPVLLIGGFITMLQGRVGSGTLMIAAIIPLGIYWRVIMMRRCRDIGWPAFLPWVFFGLQVVLPIASGGSFLSGGGPETSGAMVLSLLISVADFGFSIVIGCIKARPGAATDLDAMREAARAARAGGAEPGTDRFDQAIARAIEAQRRGESILDAPAQPARPASSPAARPVPSFGRKVV
jgi:uncharacterized membrane protein YhaH (DUF805 family)